MSTEIEERIARLENIVGNKITNEDLGSRILRTYEQIQEIIDKLPSFKPFFEQCLLFFNKKPKTWKHEIKNLYYNR